MTGCWPEYTDILNYRVEVTGFLRDGRPRATGIDVYQDTSGRWRLTLSELLYMTPLLCNGWEGDYAREWDALARRVGIRGVAPPNGATRYNDGTFAPKIYLTHR